MLQQEEEARLQEKRAKEKLEDLEVRLVPVNYASVDEVEKLVKRLLTTRGVVNIDKRTSTLILKDIPSVIREATTLVQAIDSQTPQVLIEAKVVEANLDFSRELGTEWAVGSNPADGDGDTQGDLEVAGTEYITTGSTTWPFQSANNIVASNPITSVASGLLNLSGFVLDERFNVALQLQAAESTGEGKVISSPRIVTLDNREAKIEQGVAIPFQTFENGDAQLEFIDAVLSLKVTPHITSDRSVIMKIEVTKNAPDDSVDTPTGSPAIAKNQAKTETLVKNGQTLVLGGIYVVDQSESESRIPYLHSIPLLGWAFKSHDVRDRRKELLLFVTPRIVESTLPKVASAPTAG
jgi:type IV pilus assembly protein PilQ